MMSRGRGLYFIKGERELSILRKDGFQGKRCCLESPFARAAIVHDLTSRCNASIRNDIVLVSCSSRELKVREF